MQKAMEAAGLGGSGDFLERFKGYGWYLDDLEMARILPTLPRTTDLS